jgi:hypothetical protein
MIAFALKEEALDELLSREVTTLHLSSRVVNLLHRRHIRTIGQLARHGEADLLKIRWLGESALDEIKKGLASQCLRLNMIHPLGEKERKGLMNVKIEAALSRYVLTVGGKFKFLEMLRVFHSAKVYFLRDLLESNDGRFQKALFEFMEKHVAEKCGSLEEGPKRALTKQQFFSVMAHFHKFVYSQ